MLRRLGGRIVYWCALVLAAAGISSAATISFTGSFNYDSDVQLFVVSTAGLSFDVRTFGYGGGTNSAGTIIPEGGFAPSIAVYDSTGAFIAADTIGGTYTDPVCSNGTNPYSVTSACADINTTFSIPPLQVTGTYFVLLSQQGNDAPQTSISDPFPLPPNTDFFPGVKFPDPVFFNIDGTVLQSGWAVDITLLDNGTVSTTIPEPGTVALSWLGLVGLGLWKYQKVRGRRR
jgi:hypothetical protein